MLVLPCPKSNAKTTGVRYMLAIFLMHIWQQMFGVQFIWRGQITVWYQGCVSVRSDEIQYKNIFNVLDDPRGKQYLIHFVKKLSYFCTCSYANQETWYSIYYKPLDELLKSTQIKRHQHLLPFGIKRSF